MRLPTGLLTAAALAVVLGAASACGDDAGSDVQSGADATTTTTTLPPQDPQPDHPVVDSDGALLRLELRGHRFAPRAFELALHADGSATYVVPAPDNEPIEVRLDYDAAALIELMTFLDPDDLVSGDNDCGREVDENAPILVLGSGEEIDTCYQALDMGHPVVAFMLDVKDRAADEHRKLVDLTD